MKTKLTLRMTVIMVTGLLMLSPFAMAVNAQDTTDNRVDGESDLSLADLSRYNVLEVDLYLEYDYNETLLEEGGALSLSSGLPSYAVAGTHGGKAGFTTSMFMETSVEKSKNDTTDDYIDVEGAREDAGLDHTNVTDTGVKEYSSDLYTLAGSTIGAPIGSSAETTRSVGQKLSQADENRMDYFDKEETVQYRGWESIDLYEVQAGFANDLKRGWNESYIELAWSEIQITFDWGNMKSGLDAFMADDDYDTDGMDQADIESIAEDVLPDFLRGLHLGVANDTATADTTEEYSPVEEIIATMTNKSEGLLNGFNRSTHMANGVFGYLMENYDKLTAAAAMDQFGTVDSRDFGHWSGLEFLPSQVNDTGTGTGRVKVVLDAVVDSVTSTISGIGHGTNANITSINKNAVTTLLEFLNFKPVDAAAGEVPWFGIHLTIFLFQLVLVAVFNAPSEDRFKKMVNWYVPTDVSGKGSEKVMKIAGGMVLRAIRWGTFHLFGVIILSGLYG